MQAKRGKPASRPKLADDIDRYVGHRMRAQRMLLGMSQGEVAERLDLTFQQIQKYERGVNRVGAGRLNQIADILGVPVAYFYEGAPPSASSAETQKRPSAAPGEFGVERIAGFLATKPGLLLMSAFMQIKNENVRRRLIDLIIALAGPHTRAGKVQRSRVGVGRGRSAIGLAED
jgi:transcriptional regulator with XRE-family HTH domain